MDKKDWLVLPEEATPTKHEDTYNRLLEMMNQLEEERGYRFTEKQADTIKTLIESLIDYVKSTKVARNTKSRFTLRRIIRF